MRELEEGFRESRAKLRVVGENDLPAPSCGGGMATYKELRKPGKAAIIPVIVITACPGKGLWVL